MLGQWWQGWWSQRRWQRITMMVTVAAVVHIRLTTFRAQHTAVDGQRMGCLLAVVIMVVGQFQRFQRIVVFVERIIAGVVVRQRILIWKMGKTERFNFFCVGKI